MITDRISARSVTAADIIELIETNQAELNELEFKVTPADVDLLKAACAIANSGGGFIVIGVGEDKKHCASEIVNVERADANADSVRQRMRDGIAPRPSIEVVTLPVEDKTVIIIRIAPQNPPHMIAADKRSDFYNRYDATSERMRYEEIEQRFRDKFSQGQITTSETPREVLETLSGRREVAVGTISAIKQFETMFADGKQPSLGLIAVQEAFQNAINDSAAHEIFAEPSYARKGGWTVVHPTLPTKSLGGQWQHDYGEASRTYLNASGDLVFQKAIDEVLCWRQDELDFLRQPRLYSNALVEYCLSFVYTVADIAAITRPKRIYIKTVLIVGERGAKLPLGEGGTVWFDAPASEPHSLDKDVTTAPLILELDGPIRVRYVAFKLASQLYNLFGYESAQVAFSDGNDITFETGTVESTLFALRSYLRGRLGLKVAFGSYESSRRVYWFGVVVPGADTYYRVGFSNRVVGEYGTNEDNLFAFLAPLDIEGVLSQAQGDDGLIVTTTGIKPD